MGNTNSTWRKLEGLEDPEKFVKTYKSKIKNIKPHCPTAILFMGPVKAGKSSFINAVLSVEHENKITRTNSTQFAESNTKKLAKYLGESWLKSYLFMDSRGIEGPKNCGIHQDDFMPIIQGQVKKNYVFQENTPIEMNEKERNDYYLAEPTLKNKTHCVVFVIDAVSMDAGIPEAIQNKIKYFLKELKEAEVHGVFVLTKCDILCSDVKKDIRNIFKSKKVEQTVKAASEIFGVDISSIHPVVNLAEDVQLTTANTIPIIVALNDILQNASYHYECALRDEAVV